MGAMHRQTMHEDYERARRTFHQLLDTATTAELTRPTNGTRWTNEQLLWHMFFGYLITRVLLPLVRLFSHLPDGASKGFAGLLNAATRPFDLINYAGPCGAVTVFTPRRTAAAFDRVIDSLNRRLAAEPEESLARGMHFPVRWDPFFADFMTLADVYRYPNRHLEFHRRQLTLGGGETPVR